MEVSYFCSSPYLLHFPPFLSAPPLKEEIKRRKKKTLPSRSLFPARCFLIGTHDKDSDTESLSETRTHWLKRSVCFDSVREEVTQLCFTECCFSCVHSCSENEAGRKNNSSTVKCAIKIRKGYKCPIKMFYFYHCTIPFSKLKLESFFAYMPTEIRQIIFTVTVKIHTNHSSLQHKNRSTTQNLITKTVTFMTVLPKHQWRTPGANATRRVFIKTKWWLVY